MNKLSSRLQKAISQNILPETRRSFTFYPSSASIKLSEPEKGKSVVGTCLRQQYYQLSGEKASNKVSADVKLSGIIGNKLHDLAGEMLDEFGFSAQLQRVAVEHAFYIPGINVSGRCDYIGYDHLNKEVIGIEIKTVGQWKASQCIEEPSGAHVLQSLLYLNYYKENYPDLNINKWYIVYISRTENYAIKGRKHGSPLEMIWDFHLTISPKDGAAIVHSHNGSRKWDDYTVSNMYDRYKLLKESLDKKSPPPRDYNVLYDEPTITTLHKKNQLTRKTDIAKVETWLRKGAVPGKLNLKIGDMECNYCPFGATCWPGIIENSKEEQLLNLKLNSSTSSSNDKVSKDNWF